MTAILTRPSKNYSGIRSDAPLTDIQLRAVVPAIYATNPHPEVSDRYSYLATADLVDALRAEGLGVYSAEQSSARDPKRRDYTRHIVRMRMPVTEAQRARGEYNEMALDTSHDRTRALTVRADRYRQVCNNGLVVGGTVEAIRVPHTGGIVIKDVISAATQIIESFALVDSVRDEMNEIELTREQRETFARKAIAARWDNTEVRQPVSVGSVLRPRNYEQTPNTLWATFNIVQRNLVGGGLTAISPSGRRRRTQPIRAIDANTRLNRELWDLAEATRLALA